MAYIRTIGDGDARGPLAAIFRTAIARAGRVFNILRLQSVKPATLQASIDLYLAVLHAESPLSRAEREMIAVVVSRANDCFY